MNIRLRYLLKQLWIETGRMLREGEGDALDLMMLRLHLCKYIDIIEPD